MFSANTSQVSEDRLYVEDVFSTYLYTGNGSTQTITNGIDLAGKGGLVWMKDRVASSYGNHILVDTVQTPAGSYLKTNSTDAAASSGFITFNSNGFYLPGNSAVNISGNATASWTFRKAPKFFDVVTYTGNGTFVRQINHSLGVTPGFIVVKRTDSTGNWMCVHRNNPMGELVLNSSNANTGNTDNIEVWTSTYIGVSNAANTNGATYVAYLFAHDTTSDGIIQCGSYTGNGSSTGPTVTLGWEPQWLLVKSATSGAPWRLMDVMRGLSETSSFFLDPSLSDAETPNQGAQLIPAATGFRIASTSSALNSNGQTYIYIAIRRGPMRTPTTGTSVFAPVARTGTGTVTNVTAGFAPDLHISFDRSANAYPAWYDRLRGVFKSLKSNSTAAEVSDTVSLAEFNNTGSEVWNDGTNGSINFNG